MTMTFSGDGTITGLTAGGLPDASITATDLASGAARTNIGAEGITANELASNAVTTSKITDANVTAAKLASGAARSNFGAGAVLQVVSAKFSSTFNTSSSAFVDVTGFSAAITPSSSSSKVLVICSTSTLHPSLGQGEFRILRNGSDPAGIAGGRMWTSDGYYGSGTVNDAHMTFLDSPASTSSLTYKLQIRNRHSSSMTLGQDWNGDTAGLHTITLMEIAG